MTMFGTNSARALALPAKLVKRGKLVGGRSGSKDLSEFPFGKQAKIVSAGQLGRVGDDVLRQGQQIHDLCHAGARNPRFSGNFSHTKGVVGGQPASAATGALCEWDCGRAASRPQPAFAVAADRRGDVQNIGSGEQ